MKHKNIAIFIPQVGCPHQCSFCNQCTISGHQAPPTINEVNEILQKATVEIVDKSNTEIAFFGGSFTAIDHDYMVALLETANKFEFSGIRISTRPDCINDEILTVLKHYNVTSIELGAQSMDDTVLELNMRGHSENDIVNASKLVKQYGFTLGLQMMVGLYGDTPQRCIQTCEKIIALKPDTVRIYPTVVLKGTMLSEIYNSGNYEIMPLNRAVELCAVLLKKFEDNGISVIKLGLHASKDVEDGMVTGIYHPAFRELCEAELYKNIAIDLLTACKEKNAIIYVNPTCISKLIGQKKSNIVFFKSKGYNVRVKGDELLNKFQLRVEKDG